MWHTMTAAPVAKVSQCFREVLLNAGKFTSKTCNLNNALQVYARPGEDFIDHANVHKLLGHMVESGVAAGYEEEEAEGDRGADRRWGRPPKGSSIYGVHMSCICEL